MKNNMKNILSKLNKKTIILLIISLLLIIGVTYASFNIDIKGLINIKTTFPSISLTYEEAPTALNQTNSILTEEEHKISSDYFEFKVTSTSNIVYDIYYRIYLTEKTTNTLSKDNLYIYITEVSNNTETGVLQPTKINSLRKHSTYDNSYIITSDSFNFLTETNETKEKTYRLRIWNTGTSTNNNVNINGGIYEYTVNVDTYKPATTLSVIQEQVQTASISYKYKNGANVTENGTAYNVNDNGVFLYNGTDDNGGEYPIYYYRGNVTNNNVLFANICWKIVRTTSTGGTKLIYNGLPDSNGTCNNTGTASQLSSTSAFNTNWSSPADVGYMYGTRYTYSQKNMSSVTDTYKYGNDVTYSNGTYTLSGKTMDSTSWSTDKATLADEYHYTCLNSTGTCTSVYYITYFGNSTNMYYLTFTEGDTLESAKAKMFTNTNDSTIKTTIDNWYADNLIDYSEFLENTIFCNDRSLTTESLYVSEWNLQVDGGSLLSKDTNATSFSFFGGAGRLFKGTPSLTCSRNEDKFSLKVYSQGQKMGDSSPVLSGINGIAGYGNNALNYPVGLLTYDEAMLAGGTGTSANENYYLYNEYNYWLLSPVDWDVNAAYAGRVLVDGFVFADFVDSSYGVRPVVSLKFGTKIIRGSGTSASPYIIIE